MHSVAGLSCEGMLEIVARDEQASGQVVAGRYRLERVVGEGGMGVVWAATHLVTEKPCALKFLKAARATDPKSHERLVQEARAVCRVRHPNVAPVHDVLELPSGVPFIVMDLFEGEPLSARLRRGALTPHETAAVLVPVADAVEAIHAIGIIHRDLKPDNVFLERGQRGRVTVRVLDFGIAKRVDREEASAAREPRAPAGPSLTTTYSAVGTPSYMAPEQIDGHEVGAPADVWAIGVILFECLTGARPARDDAGLVDAREIERDLTKTNLRLPASLVRFVVGALDSDPTSRPLLRDLHAAFGPLVNDDGLARDLAPSPNKRRIGAWTAMLAIVAALFAWRVLPTTTTSTTTTTETERAVTTIPAAMPSTPARTPAPSSSAEATTMPSAASPPILSARAASSMKVAARAPAAVTGSARPPASSAPSARSADDDDGIPTRERR
jgi:eukaryotic-like serine/threonine-protein kinase